MYKTTQELGFSGIYTSGGRFMLDRNYLFADNASKFDVLDTTYRTDPQVRGIFLLLQSIISNARWVLKEGGEAERNLIEENLLTAGKRTFFRQFLREATKHVLYGFAAFEKVYGNVNGVLNIEKLAWRSPGSVYRWVVNSNDEILGLEQTGDRKIPIEKLVLFTFDKVGNQVEGISLFRSSYLDNMLKEGIKKILGVHIERFGGGIAHVKMGKGLARKTALSRGAEIGEGLRSHERAYVVDIEEESETEFMAMPGKDMINGILSALGLLERSQAKGALSMFMDQTNATREVMQVFSDMFTTFIQSVAQYMSDVINSSLVSEICKLNIDNPQIPSLVPINIASQFNIDTIINALSQATTMGVLKPGPALEAYVRDLLDIPYEEQRSNNEADSNQ